MFNMLIIILCIIGFFLLFTSMVIGGGFLISLLFSIALWQGVFIWLGFITFYMILLFALSALEVYESES